jgi:hypothetical protein
MHVQMRLTELAHFVQLLHRIYQTLLSTSTRTLMGRWLRSTVCRDSSSSEEELRHRSSALMDNGRQFYQPAKVEVNLREKFRFHAADQKATTRV